MPESHLRAADTDRSQVADVLGQHMSAGRLTVAEYEQRLDRAWAARTYGELAELTADLPAASSPAVQSPAVQVVAPPAVRDHSGMRAAWLSWLSTGLVVLSIWLLTSLGSGDLQYFWPMWVIGPWGVGLAARTITRDDDRWHGRQRDRHRNRS